MFRAGVSSPITQPSKRPLVRLKAVELKDYENNIIYSGKNEHLSLEHQPNVSSLLAIDASQRAMAESARVLIVYPLSEADAPIRLDLTSLSGSAQASSQSSLPLYQIEYSMNHLMINIRLYNPPRILRLWANTRTSLVNILDFLKQSSLLCEDYDRSSSISPLVRLTTSQSRSPSPSVPLRRLTSLPQAETIGNSPNRKSPIGPASAAAYLPRQLTPAKSPEMPSFSANRSVHDLSPGAVETSQLHTIPQSAGSPLQIGGDFPRRPYRPTQQSPLSQTWTPGALDDTKAIGGAYMRWDHSEEQLMAPDTYDIGSPQGSSARVDSQRVLRNTNEVMSDPFLQKSRLLASSSRPAQAFGFNSHDLPGPLGKIRSETGASANAEERRPSTLEDIAAELPPVRCLPFAKAKLTSTGTLEHRNNSEKVPVGDSHNTTTDAVPVPASSDPQDNREKHGVSLSSSRVAISGMQHPTESSRATPVKASKKRLSKKVCTSCRQRKKRCDEKLPCSSCARDDLECVYESANSLASSVGTADPKASAGSPGGRQDGNRLRVVQDTEKTEPLSASSMSDAQVQTDCADDIMPCMSQDTFLFMARQMEAWEDKISACDRALGGDDEYLVDILSEHADVFARYLEKEVNLFRLGIGGT